MNQSELQRLLSSLRRALHNNYALFKEHAFRIHVPRQRKRSTLNAAFGDVMTTTLSGCANDLVVYFADDLWQGFYELKEDDGFLDAVTRGMSNRKKVLH